MMVTRRLFCMGLSMAALPLQAAPQTYMLNGADSSIGFRFVISGVPQTGTMPVARADLRIDPNDLGSSQVAVDVSADQARTGMFVATEALKSPGVLDTARFPLIRFTSRVVQLAPDGRLSNGARITGDLTLRDVTQPVTLDAQLFRPPGTAPDDLRHLTVELTGSVSRSAFGASAYAGLVDDTVGLDIRAVIVAV